jgi:hypothetical protein
MKRLLSAVIAAATATLLLTSCVSRTEPLVEQLATNSGLENFTLIEESTKGDCGGVPFCSDRFYELAFTAPTTVSPEQICTDVLVFTNRLKADGYSRDSQYPTASQWVGNEESAKQFCLTSMSAELTNWDGSKSYGGMLFYAPGSDDGLAKIITLRRSVDQIYVLTIGFSRDPNRGDNPANWTYTDHPATPLTQAELDEQNDFNKIAQKTMEFAQKLIGLTEQAAIDAIKEAGYSHRIAERDGEQFALTEDYSPQRINLLVADNKVFDVWVG